MRHKHGRATMPFGKHKGVRVRVCPDDYLAWLGGWLGTDAGRRRKFGWLLESIIAELNSRGLRGDLVETQDPEPPKPTPDELAHIDGMRRVTEIESKMGSFIE